MVATFFSARPQPGDGSWLLPSRSQHRKGEKKVRSFLREFTRENEGLGVKIHSGSVQSTFQPASNANLTSSPRKIASHALLSTIESDATSTEKASQLLRFPQPPATLEPDFAYILSNQGTGSPKDEEMVVPPHLRKKEKERLSALHPTSERVVAVDNAPTLSNNTSLASAAPNDIRARLERDCGVKGSDSQPAKAVLVTYASTGEEEYPNMPRKQTATALHDWDAEDSRSRHRVDSRRGSPPQHGRGSGRERGRGRGRGGKRDNSSRWPTNAEQRADPHRLVTNWSSPSNKGAPVSDVDSDWADAGGCQGRRRNVGDGSQYQLADFHGGWAPAPVDWDSRPAFRESQSAPQIESWQSSVDQHMFGMEIAIPVEATADIRTLAPNTGVVLDEFAPRYWIPTVLDSKSLRKFWDDLKKSDVPKPHDEDDLIGVTPWWTTYQSSTFDSLQPYVHPVLKGPDPDETQHESIARENDFGSNHHTENRRRTENAKKDTRREQRKRAQEKSEAIRKLSQKAGGTQVNDKIKPGLDLYIRGASLPDVKAICDLYNHHVSNSASTSECERLTETEIKHKIDGIRSAKLPFLVAYQRGRKLGGRSKRNVNGPIILPDKLVGFAFADDYNDMVGVYRFTANLEVYVDNRAFMQGIAKCLMDKLLGLLDPTYIERGGFDIEGDETAGIGAARLIQNLVINLAYDRPETLEWKSRWLENWLGFKQVGLLDGIGQKNGRSVSLAIFQRTTGLNMDDTKPSW